MSVQSESNTNWAIRYVIVAETSILILIGGFFLTGYSELVTKEDLQHLAPYTLDKPVIHGHIRRAEATLLKISDTLHILNERISASTHETTIRIQRLEDRQ